MLEEDPVKNQNLTLSLYLKTYWCCCIFDSKREDPSQFNENNMKYRACCGIFHIKHVLIVLTVLKTAILFLFLLSEMLSSDSPLGALSVTFAFSTVCITNILLTAGVRLKRYILLIPYFTVCVLFIFILVLHLFVDFLDTANSKNTIEMHSIVHNLVLLFLICFEIYMLSVVWRAFVYICDFNMQQTIEHIVRKKSMVKTSLDIEYDLVRNQIIRQDLMTNEDD